MVRNKVSRAEERRGPAEKFTTRSTSHSTTSSSSSSAPATGPSKAEMSSRHYSTQLHAICDIKLHHSPGISRTYHIPPPTRHFLRCFGLFILPPVSSHTPLRTQEILVRHVPTIRPAAGDSCPATFGAGRNERAGDVDDGDLGMIPCKCEGSRGAWEAGMRGGVGGVEDGSCGYEWEGGGSGNEA